MRSSGRADFDLVIIGSGPAGAAAAIEAATRGLTALTLDKARFPRDKCCGDGLTANALRHLEELGVEPSRIPSWQSVDDVVLVAPSGRERTFPLPRQRGHFAVVARRRELDAALVERARAAGTAVIENTEVVGISQRADRAIVTTSTGRSHTARFVVAADGMWSPTRRLLGIAQPGYRGEWHAGRQYFTNVSPRAQHELTVWFDRDLLPGYLWSFPLADGSANVGFGVVRTDDRRGHDLRSLWTQVLERSYLGDFLGPRAEPEGRYTAWPIPARLGRSPLTSDRVLFVGDAATATDPMSGEGIGQALETGRLAVEAIAASGPRASADAVTATYERVVRRGMVRDHQLARALSKVLANERGANVSLGIAGLTPWTRRNFVRWLFEDYPRAVLATPSRWHRGLFARSGAYR